MHTDIADADEGMFGRVIATNVGGTCCPGLTMTAIVETGFEQAREKLAYLRGRIPMGRAGQPDEVARVVTWLGGEESSFVTGAAIPVDGGTSV